VTPPLKTPRTLSTAEDRREAVLEAGMPLFAARGVHGTSTMDVAKAAGISQAYLFRLFPTKADLVLAMVQRCNDRLVATFEAAVAQAKAAGEDPIHAMGESYHELIQNRTMLLLQLHAHAAAPDEPAIQAAMRDCFRRLHELVAPEAGGDAERVARFFATGMLMNVMAAVNAFELNEPWAMTLCEMPTLDDPE
jgi:AcrR family transcriptional regulator